jgi:hypothetical protein
MIVNVSRWTRWRFPSRSRNPFKGHNGIDMRKSFQNNEFGHERHTRKRVDMRKFSDTSHFGSCRHFCLFFSQFARASSEFAFCARSGGAARCASRFPYPNRSSESRRPVQHISNEDLAVQLETREGPESARAQSQFQILPSPCRVVSQLYRHAAPCVARANLPPCGWLARAARHRGSRRCPLDPGPQVTQLETMMASRVGLGTICTWHRSSTAEAKRNDGIRANAQALPATTKRGSRPAQNG